ncbi:MAG: beta-ketoacyl synthase N-terminal-like domain-containing protein, partial [Actinomycetes bacterium]
MREVLGDWGACGDDTFRLPGPPYLFITRLITVSGTPGGLEIGSGLVAEYDIPEQVWFTEHSDTVPVAMLMEIALQPCGFLAAYVGSALISEQRLHIRNLDGDMTATGEVTTGVRSFRTSVELVRLDRWDDTVLETFRVRCEADGVPVLEGSAVFALSPATTLARQAGMAVTDADRQRLSQPCERPVMDLRSRPARWFGHSARLPGPMLLMLDRITGYWPDGGRAGLGRLRAESDVRADAWYFKAHFFTDPVQPGSLGVEAMGQLLQYYLIEHGVGDGFRFAPQVPASWSYRGQVVPTDSVVTIEMDVLEVVLGADGGHADAEAWLWVDGRRAYHVPRLRVRVVPGRTSAPAVVETVLDPATHRWLADHCPTWTVPVVPLMSMADMLAQAASDYAGRQVRILGDVQVQRWLPVTAPTRLRLTCLGDT